MTGGEGRHMDIQGLQKLTLLDFPEHTACTVFLAGCDFRCPFCHNYELVEGRVPAYMTEDEFFAFLDKRHGLLDGVAITGGEPCLRPGLADFIRRIKAEGFMVKLDTNGNHPDLLRRLIDEQLVDYVAMDVKNSPGKYARTIGLESFDTSKVSESIAILLGGRTGYEFRTTVSDRYHEVGDFIEIGKWIKGADNYFIQAFTDREAVPDHSLKAPEPEKLREFLETVRPFVKRAELRGVDDN